MGKSLYKNQELAEEQKNSMPNHICDDFEQDNMIINLMIKQTEITLKWYEADKASKMIDSGRVWPRVVSAPQVH